MYHSTKSIRKWIAFLVILVSFVFVILWLISGQSSLFEPLLVLLSLISGVLLFEW